MAEQEGVIKYRLDYQPHALLTDAEIREIDSWRHICYRLGLIGQSAERYQGFGFGNISQRYTRQQNAFIISGTQTGCKPFLTANDYALVTDCQPGSNFVGATGAAAPSSEAMTHGQLYQLDSNIQVVVHAHSPEIWNHAAKLGLPMTKADVAYGTVAMVQEVERLFTKSAVHEQQIFVMLGHQDGVVSFAHNAADAVAVMTNALAAALRC